jgi:hypothetical protein
MTTVEIVFPFAGHPTESTIRAVNTVREVYGIRRILFDEGARTVRVEYDATRLSASGVQQLLRRTGLALGDKLTLVTDAPPPPPPAPPQPPAPGAAKP